MSDVNWILSKILEDQSAITRFEEKYGIKFPEEFKSIVRQFNGGRPRPNIFDSTQRKELVAKALLSFNESHTENIWDTYESLKTRLPKNIIPFLTDQFGNYICFDYRNTTIPTIVLWDHEKAFSYYQDAIIYVEDTFESFLASLYSID